MTNSKNLTLPQLKQIKDYLNRPAMDRLLIFYGIPELYNGLGNIDEIVSSIHRSYDIVVFGDGLQRPDNQFHANTAAIVKKLTNLGVRVYGYVSIAAPWRLSTPGDLTTLKQDVVYWKDTGAKGIFLDEAGFDYGVPRTGQNEVLTYIHSLGLGTCLNAWQFQDVVCTNVSETDWVSTDAEYQNFVAMNPNNVAPVVDKNRDSYLFESFCISELGLATEADTQVKGNKILSLNSVGLEIFAVARIHGTNTSIGNFIPDISSTNKSEKTLLEYIQVNAVVFGINALGFSDSGFGSDTSYALDWNLNKEFSWTRGAESVYRASAVTEPLLDLSGLNTVETLTNSYERDFGTVKLSVRRSSNGDSSHSVLKENGDSLFISGITTSVNPQNYTGLYDSIHYLPSELKARIGLTGTSGIPDIALATDSYTTSLAFNEKDCDVAIYGNKAVTSSGLEASVAISNSATQTPSSTANGIPFGYTRYSTTTGVSSIYLYTDATSPRWGSLSKYSMFDFSCDFALTQVNKTSNLRLEIGVASTGAVNTGLDTQPYGSIWLKQVSGVFTVCMKGNSLVRSISTGRTASVGEYRLDIKKIDNRGLVVVRLTKKTTKTESVVVFDLVNDAKLVPAAGNHYLWPVFGISNLGTPTTLASVDIRKIVVFSKLR